MKNIPELSWLIWSHHYDMFVQSNNPVYCALALPGSRIYIRVHPLPLVWTAQVNREINCLLMAYFVWYLSE